MEITYRPPQGGVRAGHRISVWIIPDPDISGNPAPLPKMFQGFTIAFVIQRRKDIVVNRSENSHKILRKNDPDGRFLRLFLTIKQSNDPGIRHLFSNRPAELRQIFEKSTSGCLIFLRTFLTAGTMAERSGNIHH